jgi:hypothetical protein
MVGIPDQQSVLSSDQKAVGHVTDDPEETCSVENWSGSVAIGASR